MVHQSIDGSCCGHRVFEDLIPLAEGEIARQQHAAAFVAFRQQSKENLHLFAALLYVPEVVDDQPLEARKVTKGKVTKGVRKKVSG